MAAMTRELIVTDDMPEEALRMFREARPRTLVLAGGETPRRIYRRLSQEEYCWDEVDVFFSDERCVPPDHPDSNFRMANEALLSFVAARVHRMPGETCDAASYERELREMSDGAPPRFDLAFLGLGPDGHTASLFPGDPALDERERWVVRVARPDHERMTLTLPLLSAARLAVFLVAGAEKRDALRRMMAGEDIPANRITAERAVVLADAAASAGVEGK
jgi:6-phosphogluconolactonase